MNRDWNAHKCLEWCAWNVATMVVSILFCPKWSPIAQPTRRLPNLPKNPFQMPPKWKIKAQEGIPMSVGTCRCVMIPSGHKHNVQIATCVLSDSWAASAPHKHLTNIFVPRPCPRRWQVGRVGNGSTRADMDGLSEQKDMMVDPDLRWHGGKMPFVTLTTKDNIFDTTILYQFA